MSLISYSTPLSKFLNFLWDYTPTVGFRESHIERAEREDREFWLHVAVNRTADDFRYMSTSEFRRMIEENMPLPCPIEVLKYELLDPRHIEFLLRALTVKYLNRYVDTVLLRVHFKDNKTWPNILRLMSRLNPEKVDLWWKRGRTHWRDSVVAAWLASPHFPRSVKSLQLDIQNDRPISLKNLLFPSELHKSIIDTKGGIYHSHLPKCPATLDVVQINDKAYPVHRGLWGSRVWFH